MKIWFDTEFLEDGKTIELISIGMVREDGATLYLENSEFQPHRATHWLKENVLPHLRGGDALADRATIASKVRAFAGLSPEFWAYYADYDWVVLCQLYGRMIDLPISWPKWCRDVKQYASFLGNPELPKQLTTEHHALADAIWVQEAWALLEELRLAP